MAESLADGRRAVRVLFRTPSEVVVSNFRELDSLFVEFLAQPGSALSASERDEVKEYVDVGEYGLALRTAVAIFDEERKIATADERSLVHRLATAMSIDPEPLLNRMKM